MPKIVRIQKKRKLLQKVGEAVLCENKSKPEKKGLVRCSMVR